MIDLEVVIPPENFATNRKDAWWIPPISLGVSFFLFAVYSLAVTIFDFNAGIHTFGNLVGTHYNSPFYGPEPWFSWPAFLPFAFFTLWAPFGFRGTCYYMRRVYYRSFFAGPPACAVDGLSKFKGKYKGESKLPWVLNNFHRYFMYLAVILALYHWYEAIHSFVFIGASGNEFGMGIGTILAVLDATTLTLYVSTCHAFRHMMAGRINRQGKISAPIAKFLDKLNPYHGRFFWLSLTTVWIWDIYVRLMGHGILDVVRLF